MTSDTGTRGLRALVLAAGLGTRLQPLTLARAKAAAPVDGEPLARRTIRWLVGHGVRDLVLNLHHKPESITAAVGDGGLLLHVFEELGFQVWFRYEKYREEFAHEDVTVAIDETPVGVFVEIEGTERGISAMAAAMGRGPSDYILDSYRSLFVQRRDAFGLTGNDMVFDSPE